jgi:hypothetical protein
MNLIIELIIKIFHAIFEEDVRDRQPKRSRVPPQQQSPAESALAELFAELQKPKQQAQGPPPVPQSHARTLERQRVANLERIRQEKRHIRNESEENSIHMGAYGQEHPSIVTKKLPGRSPLQQMIYAGVILGPCKAQAHKQRRLF